MCSVLVLTLSALASTCDGALDYGFPSEGAENVAAAKASGWVVEIPGQVRDSGHSSFGQRVAFGLLGAIGGVALGSISGDEAAAVVAVLGGAAGVLLATSKLEGLNPRGTVLGAALGGLPALVSVYALEGEDRILSLLSIPGIPIGAALGSDWYPGLR